MAGIPTGNILQPGAISLSGGATRQLISDLQLLTPQSYTEYVQKYGNEDFTWFLSAYGGVEEVKNRNYFWWENRGKLQIGVQAAANVASANNNTITLTLASADHYNSGTQSPLRAKETVRVASTNVEGEILAVDTSVAGAFTFTVRPKKLGTNLASAGSTSFLTTDVLLFGGYMDVGEASTSINPLIHLDQKYENNTTEMRETWSATDLAELTEVWYKSGVTGPEMAGGMQAGYSYFTYKGLVKSNQRFINNMEFKLMRGDVVSNTGLTTNTSVGSQGFIPKILADGETVGYTAGTLDIPKLHEITRIMDVNGCANEALWLMDIYQRQSFSDSIFKEYPAGAFVWGQKEASQEASIAYGVDSFKLDGYLLKAKKYKQFNSEVTVGLTPDVDYFRDFGIICPQGTARDAKDATKVYKNLTILGQQPPKGGTIGNGIRVWEHGGASIAATNGTMTDNVELYAIRGSRVVAANQFLTIQS